jgi:hypothetical protein
MTPLAKFWTFTGNIFIPLAIGWVLFVRNAFGDKIPADGVLISRGYLGLLITLIAANLLLRTFTIYVELAKRWGEKSLVPYNSTFEDAKERNTFISYGTIFVFFFSIIIFGIIFSVRYFESNIYNWDNTIPLAHDFIASRVMAHEIGCRSQPCFAIGSRIDSEGNSILGINEYILYFTDGILLLLALVIMAGFVRLIFVLRKSIPGDA